MADLGIKDQAMRAQIKKLKSLNKEFERLTGEMTKSVNTLCSNWKSKSTETYKQDYAKLTGNFKKTSGVVTDLIKSTEKYLDDMDKLDAAYSKSKVSTGGN